MWTKWLLAGVATAVTAVPVFAADLAAYPAARSPYRHIEVTSHVTIVPDCRELDPIVLGCAPRAILPDGPAYEDARRQYLEMGRPVKPYMQLFTWSR